MSERVNQLSPRWQMMLALGTLYFVWGSTFLGIHYALESMPPFLLASARFLFAGGVLYVWMRLRGIPNPTRLNTRAGLIVGGLLLLGGNGGLTFAEQYVPTSFAAVMIGAIPLWTVMLDWLIYGGGRPTRRVAAGLAGGFLGIALLAGPSSILGGENLNPLGVVALIFAALTWAVGSLYARRAPLPRVPLMATGLEMLAGGAWLALAGTLAGEWSELDVSAISLKSVVALGYLAVVGSLIGFTVYIWLLRNTTPARATSYAYVSPVVALVLGATLAGEDISLRTIAAAAIIIGSVVLLTSQQPERKTAEATKTIEHAVVTGEMVASSTPCP
jgi:drug/metabolite transporter (DMT)-like permease